MPVDVVPVLIAKGDNRKPEFLKLSPLGKIPCLQASLACAALCGATLCGVVPCSAGSAALTWLNARATPPGSSESLPPAGMA